MNDLLSDLQADLTAPAAAPAPTAAPAPAAAPPAPVLPLPTAPPTRTTPAFELRVTPLRWALPGLQFDGGVCLHVGPVQVGVTRR